MARVKTGYRGLDKLLVSFTNKSWSNEPAPESPGSESLLPLDPRAASTDVVGLLADSGAVASNKIFAGSDQSARIIFKGADQTVISVALTGSLVFKAAVDSSRARTVRNYSRMGIVRGIPSRLFVPRQNAAVVSVAGRALVLGTDTTSKTGTATEAPRFYARGVTTYSKSTSWSESARFLLRGSSTGAPSGFAPTATTDVAGRSIAFGTVDSDKIGESTPAGVFKPLTVVNVTAVKTSPAVTGSIKARGAVDAGKVRTVSNYTRFSLLRGVPGRRYGSFRRQGQTTDINARSVLRAATTATKFGATSVTARTLDFGTDSPSKRMSSTAAGSVQARGATTEIKFGATALGGFFLRQSSDVAGKLGSTTVAGRFRPQGFVIVQIQGRSLTKFTKLGLNLLPSRRNASFARTPGVYLYGLLRTRGATTEVKTGLGGVSGLMVARGAHTYAHVSPSAQSGAVRAAATNTVARTSVAAHAGRFASYGATTYLRITGPTYDVRGQGLPRGSSTGAKTSSVGGGSDRVSFYGLSDFVHKGAGSAAGALRIFTSTTYGQGPKADLFTRLQFFGASTSLVVQGLTFKVRVYFRGTIDASKSLSSSDTQGSTLVRGASTGQKSAGTGVAGQLISRANLSGANIGPTVNLPRGGGSTVGRGVRLQGDARGSRLQRTNRR